MTTMMTIEGRLVRRVGVLLRDCAERRRLRQALDRVYRHFAFQYPEWTAALFDKHFIAARVAPMIMATHAGRVQLSPQMIADAWSRQMVVSETLRHEVVEAATPIAAELLRLIAQELDRPAP